MTQTERQLKAIGLMFRPEMVRAYLAGVKYVTRRALTCRIKPGQEWYGKETWQQFCPTWDGAWCACGSKDMQRETHLIAYRATNTGVNYTTLDQREMKCVLPLRWKSSMFMPRWASRFGGVCQSVRVERLQDITEADAILEGMEHVMRDGETNCEAFARYIDEIRGAGFWASNPEVKRIELKAEAK